MAIHIFARHDGEPDRVEQAREGTLFLSNLELLLNNAQVILNNSEYFFCPLLFATRAFLWVGGGGPLCLGHLLLGWSDGILLEPCRDCSGEILVARFSGSVLTGTNSWFGFCASCVCKKSGCDSIHKPFLNRMKFGVGIRKMYPQEISSWEEYDGVIFSWGGNGLQPARKKRLVVTPTAIPVTLETLIHELNTGNIRSGDPPKPIEQDHGLQFELHFKNNAVLRFPPNRSA